ncbi:ras-interacting protein RIP3-like [Entelurus aequoreus]|uniref:ras-interacting protein RIP3-like n=1 Tax=Entelurus aequoreus TaxID=161455 RepID=UPI002B1D043E|nr:ras-interacting protein RIP3-like [Entelurus aequoreus]
MTVEMMKVEMMKVEMWKVHFMLQLALDDNMAISTPPNVDIQQVLDQLQPQQRNMIKAKLNADEQKKQEHKQELAVLKQQLEEAEQKLEEAQQQLGEAQQQQPPQVPGKGEDEDGGEDTSQ